MYRLLAKGTGAAVRVAVTQTMHLRTISGALQGSGTMPAGASKLAKARAVIPVCSHFTSVRLQIPSRNVSTLTGKSAFWSGLEGRSAEAKALAKASGRTSLQLTPGSMWLEEHTGLLGKQVDWFTQMRPQWARLSGRFARQARRSVEVFKGPKFDFSRSI